MSLLDKVKVLLLGRPSRPSKIVSVAYLGVDDAKDIWVKAVIGGGHLGALAARAAEHTPAGEVVWTAEASEQLEANLGLASTVRNGDIQIEADVRRKEVLAPATLTVEVFQRDHDQPTGPKLHVETYSVEDKFDGYGWARLDVVVRVA